MVESTAGRVVVGVADTLAGYQALRYAVAHARQHRRPMIAVRAFPSNQGESLEWRSSMMQSAQAVVIKAFVEALGGPPTDVSITVVTGPGTPGGVLVGLADRPEDVLVIGGSSARRWWRRRRALVARDCSRRAICPVVVVPEPALARTGSALDRSHTAAEAERFLRSQTSAS